MGRGIAHPHYDLKPTTVNPKCHNSRTDPFMAKLGFLARRPLKEEAPKITTPAAQRFRAVRPLRETRATRLIRLAPGQRFVQIAEHVRRWLGDKLGLQQKEVVAEKVTEKVTPTESVKQTEKLRHSQREEVRQSIEQHRQQRQQPRLSRGIGH